MVRDVNFNLSAYWDQYGNLVQIQPLTDTGGMQLQNVYVPVKDTPIFTTDQGVYVPVHETVPVTTGATVSSTAALRANPFIQQFMEKHVAVLESCMKSELLKGSTQEKVGDTMWLTPLVGYHT